MPISTHPSLPLAALFVGLATLTAPLWTSVNAAPQDPDEVEEVQDPEVTVDDGDELDPELEALLGRDRPSQDWVLDEKWQGLLGTWQLMQFDHVDNVIEIGDVAGYVNLGEGVMTMIIHARNDQDNEMPERLAQAGIHRWRIARGDILQTATMMAHSNMGEELEWETPNTPREFRIELDGSNLTLHRPDASRLVLRRVDGFAFPDAAKEAMRDARASGE